MHADAHGATHAEAMEHQHPGPAKYVVVAVILTIITIVEVLAIWPTLPFEAMLGGWVVPFLLVLSAAKFSMVVMFFMHLKYDSKLFTGFFVSGLLIAISVIIALLALLDNLVPPTPPAH